MQKASKSLTRLLSRLQPISKFFPWFWESSDSDTFSIKTSISSLATFCLFNSSKIIMISWPWRRIRHFQRGSSRFTALIDFPPIASTLCLMADMVVACLLWHDIAFCDAPDVLRNLAMDFSSIELLPSPAIPKSAVDSHGKRTCQATRLLQCTCIIVITDCRTCCTVMR